MKKTTFFLTALLVIIITMVTGWYILTKKPDSTVSEVLKNILPFGSGDNTNRATLNNPNTTNNGGDTLDSKTTNQFGSNTATIFRISDTPIAGSRIFKKGKNTVVRYVDRATGHIYDADLTTLTKTKVLNQTLPKIYEAYFSSDGKSILLRYLKDNSDVIENLTLTLTPPQGTSTESIYSVSSAFLRGDINSITVGSSNNIFYSLKDTASIISSAFNGVGAKILFQYPYTDWQLVTAGKNLILYTKASATVPGLAYILNTSDGTFSKILGPLNGLIVIANTTGNQIAYSYIESSNTDSSSIKMFLSNITNNTIIETPFETLAEKCVWSVKNTQNIFCAVPADWDPSQEPDNWYRGSTHFSDRLWLFNADTNTSKILMEPKTTLGMDIDLTDPQLSPDEDYLTFMNKTDLTLWVLKLKPL
jgi:hypothetical protein